MFQSQSLKELAIALNKAQSQLKKAKKDSQNPHFRSKYADLESVWDACREALNQNGLTVIQTVGTMDNKATLTTMLLHTSGEYVSDTALLPVIKGGPQELGSCLTYLKRYSLSAIVGIADSDDDGEIAEGRRNDFQKTSTQTEPIPVYVPLKSNVRESAPSVTAAEVNLPPSQFIRQVRPLTAPQIKRLYAIAGSTGWPPAFVDAYVNKHFKKNAAALSKQEYDSTCETFQNLKCTDFQKDELKPFVKVKNAVAELEKAKYVDHTAPSFDQDEQVPF